MASNAVSSNAVSTVVGVLLNKGNFSETTRNLPQSIAILAEANDANQSGLSTAPSTVTSIKQVATAYGYGSPIYNAYRILANAGVAIPVTVYPQAAAVGAVAKVITVTTTGTATANGTIYLKINGRKVLDGGNYAVNIVTGDTPTIISGKMRAAVAGVLGSTVIGTGTTTAIFTAKWAGLTSNEINITFDLNGSNTGCTFAAANTTAGSGTPSVSASLAMFGGNWQTFVINGYGLVDAAMTEFENFNGIPDPTTPTGRYAPTTWKPFICLSGTLLDDPRSLTSANARVNNVTITACPAPLSLGLSIEAAANRAVKEANQFQNLPEGDIIDEPYVDMPAAADGSIPQMTDYAFRQSCVLAGCSTVDYVGGRYIMKDCVTTYAPDGELPPYYRWVRDLNVYFNFEYGYRLLCVNKIKNRTIINDNDVSSSTNIIKPKMFKADISAYVADCINRALVVDQAFTDKSIVVEINSDNPNRLDATFNIKISGISRIIATTITGGFNTGN